MGTVTCELENPEDGVLAGEMPSKNRGESRAMEPT